VHCAGWCWRTLALNRGEDDEGRQMPNKSKKSELQVEENSVDV
jgi:hypothetical protein